ncbi:MAG: DnaB-like helicase N-terminal domain-containing protein, partial [Lysobacteraceae bacterium]
MAARSSPYSDARKPDDRGDHRIEALRVPPQSVDAEQAVLGGLMLAPDTLDHVVDHLDEDDFYRRDHRLIYRAICELSNRNKPFDVVTLGEWFDNSGLADQIGGSAYLIELASTTPSAANIGAYAAIVREKSVLRRLIDAGTEIVNDGFQPGNVAIKDVLDKAEERVFK